MILHKTQKEALKFLLNAIETKEPIVALIGAGGVGKSEVLSRISKLTDKKLIFTATTNKAASRLSKDIPGACTIHSVVAIPTFKRFYENIQDYINCSTKEKETFDLIQEAKNFIQKYNVNLKSFFNIEDMLHSIGVSSFDPEIFNGYILQDPVPNTTVIIDECSMLPEKSYYHEGSLITIGLDSVYKVFSQIILVGDNAQLPPINSKSSFDGIKNYELTKNYRSNKDLLRAIQWARDKKSFWDWENKEKEDSQTVRSVPDSWYKASFCNPDVVHICYTNKTRHKITKRIRKGQQKTPLDGEPLIWRGKSEEELVKGEIGIYNKNSNAVCFEKTKEYINKGTNFDEYDTDYYARLAYGYALTAHSAQGSGFDHVIVHLYDMPGFINKETKNKWVYTAVSRAKKSLTIIL